MRTKVTLLLGLAILISSCAGQRGENLVMKEPTETAPAHAVIKGEEPVDATVASVPDANTSPTVETSIEVLTNQEPKIFPANALETTKKRLTLPGYSLITDSINNDYNTEEARQVSTDCEQTEGTNWPSQASIEIANETTTINYKIHRTVEDIAAWHQTIVNLSFECESRTPNLEAPQILGADVTFVWTDTNYNVAARAGGVSILIETAINSTQDEIYLLLDQILTEVGPLRGDMEEIS